MNKDAVLNEINIRNRTAEEDSAVKKAIIRAREEQGVVEELIRQGIKSDDLEGMAAHIVDERSKGKGLREARKPSIRFSPGSTGTGKTAFAKALARTVAAAGEAPPVLVLATYGAGKTGAVEKYLKESHEEFVRIEAQDLAGPDAFEKMMGHPRGYRGYSFLSANPGMSGADQSIAALQEALRQTMSPEMIRRLEGVPVFTGHGKTPPKRNPSNGIKPK